MTNYSNGHLHLKHGCQSRIDGTRRAMIAPRARKNTRQVIYVFEARPPPRACRLQSKTMTILGLFALVFCGASVFSGSQRGYTTRTIGGIGRGTTRSRRFGVGRTLSKHSDLASMRRTLSVDNIGVIQTNEGESEGDTHIDHVKEAAPQDDQSTNAHDATESRSESQTTETTILRKGSLTHTSSGVESFVMA
jgi:hypothetical protein